VGVWHELLVTNDVAFAELMWPVVRAGIEFTLGLQAPRGEIIWRRHADGTPADYALLTCSSSIYQSLRCAIALADYLGEAQPDWELAADQLGHAVACHPEALADKSRYSMDWYYPVLGGPVRGSAAAARLGAGWQTFVVPGLGARCVSDEPWVTGAETCELAMALDAIGDRARALDQLAQMQHLRDRGGAYWTGWQFANRAHFPAEQSSWTAAAVILAADTLSGATRGSGIFREAAAGPAITAPVAGAGCGGDARARRAAGAHPRRPALVVGDRCRLGVAAGDEQHPEGGSPDPADVRRGPDDGDDVLLESGRGHGSAEMRQRIEPASGRVDDLGVVVLPARLVLL